MKHGSIQLNSAQFFSVKKEKEIKPNWVSCIVRSLKLQYNVQRRAIIYTYISYHHITVDFLRANFIKTFFIRYFPSPNFKPKNDARIGCET